jgi:hypothetical protein
VLYRWEIYIKKKIYKYNPTLFEAKRNAQRTIIKMAIIKIRHDSKSKKDDIVLLE